MVIDITQELFSCKVFPGDPAPQRQTLGSMAQGDLYNLTAFSMCAHNGTHIDAPAHFIADGRTVEQLPPEVFVGDCYVARHTGDVTAEVLEDILAKARAAGAGQRILVAGKAVLTAPRRTSAGDCGRAAVRQRKPDRRPGKRPDGGA